MEVVDDELVSSLCAVSSLVTGSTRCLVVSFQCKPAALDKRVPKV